MELRSRNVEWFRPLAQCFRVAGVFLLCFIWFDSGCNHLRSPRLLCVRKVRGPAKGGWDVTCWVTFLRQIQFLLASRRFIMKKRFSNLSRYCLIYAYAVTTVSFKSSYYLIYYIRVRVYKPITLLINIL